MWFFTSFILLLPALAVNHYIAYIGGKSYRLPHYQHRVGAYCTVCNDYGGADEADNPEANGQYRDMKAVGIIPLVDEAEREYNLSGRAE